MKKDIHPKYRKVLFVDSSTGFSFVCGSTQSTEETEVYKGVEYPVYRVSISSASHPFFTGSKGAVDTEGRMERFTNRYKKVAEKHAANQEKQLEKQQEAKKKSTKKTPSKKR